ncbi:MAG: ABC transporter ATP-binding protein [Acidobacteria bacterium]|nr:ABC transporter ATP-binding protein [Acidobacteriota bacterium]MCA1638656.1 ABC transporter ATP-binding protein [Acidobacteriota bacterium]
MSKILLEVSNLQTQFKLEKNIIRAVNGVSFSIDEGEVLGIVGESGCGKSVTALSIMRLIETPGEITNGKAIFRDEDKETDLLTLSDKKLEDILGNRISMIFQDPMTSLNPVLSVGYQIMETLRVHRGLSFKEAKERGIHLLQSVGIVNARGRFNDYPHEFSGGMRQRVMIAMAIACQPKLLIADEPTTALDVTIQAQILSLLRKFKKEFGMSIIIITHDLGVVAQIADRVAVMYAGRIVENASVREIFNRPQHPYTQALIASIPRLDEQSKRLKTIEGAPPRFLGEENACSFYPRCSFRIAVCAEKRPPLAKIHFNQSVACFVAHQGVFNDG